MTNTTGQIGALIRETRQKLGIAQKDLALAAGTGIRFVADLESGNGACEIGKSLAVLNALGIRMVLLPPTMKDE